MRTFIELAMPDDVTEAIRRRQDEVRGTLGTSNVDRCFRWTDVAKVHLTLRFLGETTDAQSALVAGGLDEVAQRAAALTLAIGGPGAFPNLRQPRVLWLGVDGDLDGLRALQAEVERLSQSYGFDAEEKPYSPHLTIARARREASGSDLQRAGDAIAQVSARQSQVVESDRFLAERIVHVRSDLRPGGSVYTPLSTHVLMR